jgi:flagellar biosynthesis component FlhA
MSDQRTFWAAIVTMVVWVAIAVISVAFLLIAETSSLGAAIFIILMAGMGIGGMAVVWDSPESRASAPPTARSEQRRSRKKKHAEQESMARLLETLDEDQIIELETLLMAQQDDNMAYHG